MMVDEFNAVCAFIMELIAERRMLHVFSLPQSFPNRKQHGVQIRRNTQIRTQTCLECLNLLEVQIQDSDFMNV